MNGNQEYENPSFEDINALIQQFEESVFNDDALFLNADSYLQIIEHYEDHLQTEQASAATDCAVQQYPFTAIFIVKKARFTYEAGESHLAIEMLEQAAIFDNTEVEIYILRAEILATLQLYTEAKEELEYALQWTDKLEKVDILLTLSDIHESFFDTKASFNALCKAARLQPDNTEVLERLSFCIDELENFEEGLKIHEFIIDEDPYSEHAWFNLGKSYAGLELFEKAIDAYSYAIAINEEFYEAIFHTAESYYEIEDFAKALEFYLICSRLRKPDEELFYNLGYTYFHLEKLEKATYYFKKAIIYDPAYGDAYFQLGRIQEEKGFAEPALQYYAKSIEIEEDCIEYLDAFASLSFDLGKYQQASENYILALKVNPIDEKRWLRLAECYHLLGLHEEALLVAEMSLKSIPNSAQLKTLMGIFEWECGKKEAAMFSFTKGLREDVASAKLIFDYLPHLKQQACINDLIALYSL